MRWQRNKNEKWTAEDERREEEGIPDRHVHFVGEVHYLGWSYWVAQEWYDRLDVVIYQGSVTSASAMCFFFLDYIRATQSFRCHGIGEIVGWSPACVTILAYWVVDILIVHIWLLPSCVFS